MNNLTKQIINKLLADKRRNIVHRSCTKVSDGTQCRLQCALSKYDLHHLTVGYTADSFYRSDDPTNSVKALKEGG